MAVEDWVLSDQEQTRIFNAIEVLRPYIERATGKELLFQVKPYGCLGIGLGQFSATLPLISSQGRP